MLSLSHNKLDIHSLRKLGLPLNLSRLRLPVSTEFFDEHYVVWISHGNGNTSKSIRSGHDTEFRTHDSFAHFDFKLVLGILPPGQGADLDSRAGQNRDSLFATLRTNICSGAAR